MNWKNYSTEHCDQTVTDIWLRFRYLVASTQGNLKHSHLLVVIITWNAKVDDLEKLLHRAL